MKLRTVIMRNFRAYRQETRIPISGLTAFVGRNDIGKSTVLEALEIFFNNSSPKMDEKDGSISGDAKDVMIGCEFSDLPDEVVLDATASTSLRGEFLLNPTGLLEIHKVFDCTVKTPKDSVFAFAAHPTEELLSLKNSDLKKKTKELKINLSDVDERSNPQLRRAIWAALGPGDLSPRTIQIDKGEDAKSIWEGIKREFPIFALFRSDRPSRDEDDEVQDPMRLAIIEALREVQPQLDEIKQSIRNKATEVAQRTLAKLREMDQDLAGELAPNFKAEPKWDSLFKMALSGDDQIPVNKRGSGVRRLILINFFRAEAERKQHKANAPGLIYAIEEPETSQHPDYQRLLVRAFTDLVERTDCQVLLTTHVPGFAELIPVDSLRYIRRNASGHPEVCYGSPEIYDRVAESLGVLPDPIHPQVLVAVEGRNDVAFLRRVCGLLRAEDPSLPDLSNRRIAVLPVGGSMLKHWVERGYFNELQVPVCGFFDRDRESPPRYSGYVDEINLRGDGSFAMLSSKAEIENYYHADAIQEGLGFSVRVDDDSDIAEALARIQHEASESTRTWDEIGDERRCEKIKRAKNRLEEDALPRMTAERLRERDLTGDFLRLFQAVRGCLDGERTRAGRGSVG